MKYDIFDLDEVTLDDALRFYANGKTLMLNDGKIVDIVEEKD